MPSKRSWPTAAHEDVTLVALSQAARSTQGPGQPRNAHRLPHRAQTRAILAALTGADRQIPPEPDAAHLALRHRGARVSEITGLTLQDLPSPSPGTSPSPARANKTRVVPLTGKTIGHLRVYLAEFHPDAAAPARNPAAVLQPPRRAAHPAVSEHGLSGAQPDRSICAPDCPTIPGNIHCHLLRKTKAMDLYQQGIPLPIIMRLLGHENASTTAAFYAFATMDMMRQAINTATPAINDPVTESAHRRKSASPLQSPISHRSLSRETSAASHT